MRQISRVDRNQAQIVSALRQLSYKVRHTHQLGRGVPDIICAGYNLKHSMHMMVWVEIKMPGEKLTTKEEEFFQEWRGMPVIVAESVEDILKWFGRAYYGQDLAPRIEAEGSPQNGKETQETKQKEEKGA